MTSLNNGALKAVSKTVLTATANITVSIMDEFSYMLVIANITPTQSADPPGPGRSYMFRDA